MTHQKGRFRHHRLQWYDWTKIICEKMKNRYGVDYQNNMILFEVVCPDTFFAKLKIGCLGDLVCEKTCVSIP